MPPNSRINHLSLDIRNAEVDRRGVVDNVVEGADLEDLLECVRGADVCNVCEGNVLLPYGVQVDDFLALLLGAHGGDNVVVLLDEAREDVRG